MAGNSISAQLQALKSLSNVHADSEPLKKPFTRPSLIFDPKEAADTDLDTILNIALSGLEVLIDKEERFRNYRNDLFSYKSKELDRELLGIGDNDGINASISSYLRLLTGYLELSSAVNTLEYLIRRYKVHVYNTEELILCALPYHETHVFVQIVQLINAGNSRWKFLDGVKTSGAPLPRHVIVQQCIQDMGVLEAICNYAAPLKKIHQSKVVTGFCTAVVFEVLRVVTIDSDVVKRILPYLNSGLQPGAKGSNQKAGALIIVTLLAQKVALAPNVVKGLMRSIADIVRADVNESADLQCVRMSFMALINFVQLQSVLIIPRKTLDVVTEIRDITGILLGLTKDYNIDKFLAVFLDSLLEHCLSDDIRHSTLLSMIETIPLKEQVSHIVSKLLNTCMRISFDKKYWASSESGSRARKILDAVHKHYQFESGGAIHRFLKEAKMKFKKDCSSYDMLCKIFDGILDLSNGISDLKFLFALEHPEVEVRRLVLSSLDVDGITREKAAGSKKFVAIQDAILQQLYEDDLSVVLAVLNLKKLSEIINSARLIEALQHVIQRCSEILLSSSLNNSSLPYNAAVLCLQQLIMSFKDLEEHASNLAMSIFPLILIHPKTWRLNLKALELAKELKWSLYRNLNNLSGRHKKLDPERISSVNMENISKLAETFLLNPEEYMPWLTKCCNAHMQSKKLFFSILLQSLMASEIDFGQFSVLFDSCFPILRKEWGMLESVGISSEQQSNRRILDEDCIRILEHVSDTNIKDLNVEILACLFWRLLEALIATAPEDASLDRKGKWVCMLQDLFFFFASNSKDIFKKHLEYLVIKCKISPLQMMLKLFTEEGAPPAVQAESLCYFSNLCSQTDDGSSLQLLAEFPAILVPLSSDNQNVRVAAMSCIEELSKVWSHTSDSGSNSGNDGVWLHFLGGLLDLVVRQKKLILSDRNLLSSFFTSLLSSSAHSLLVQQAIGNRFDQSTKDEILVFMLGYSLGLSAYAKLRILSLLKGLGSKIMCVVGVRSLLNDLLERRHQYHLENNRACEKLSKIEVDILCLLLESCTRHTSAYGGHDFEDPISKALQLNGIYTEDSAVVEPCITALRNLSSSLYGDMRTETQEFIFQNILILFRSAMGDIQNAAREALTRIHINSAMVDRVLNSILGQNHCSVGLAHGKKRKGAHNYQNPDPYNLIQHRENTLLLVSSLLDVLLLKKNIENRSSLLGPLFKLLRMIYMNNEWPHKTTDKDTKHETSSGTLQTLSDTAAYIQQTLLSTLEDISASLVNDIPGKGDIVQNFDLELLVNYARSTSDAITRNHVFSLLTILTKIIPDKVLDYTMDIITVIGESTVTQWDSYSQHVFEDLTSAVVPCWISRTDNAEKFLQIFVSILPQVVEQRRLPIIVHILRTLGEADSLGSLLFLLFHSLVSRKSLFSLSSNPSLDQLTSIINRQWEYVFALQLCEQYSCTIWLPSVVSLLQKTGNSNLSEDMVLVILAAVQFISDKLRDPEIAYKLDSGEDLNKIQVTVGALMEQVVFHLQLINSKRKHISLPSVIRKELKEYFHAVLKTVTNGLLPATYFSVIINLLGHVDRSVRKKALGVLCETVKDSITINAKLEKRGLVSSIRSLWLHLDETSLESFNNLCLEILKLVDCPDDDSSTSLKLAAVSALEVLANKFPSHDSVFSMCLGSVSRRICSDNSSLSSRCLHATGALINVLGPKALPELPGIMGCVVRKSRDVPSVAAETKRIVDRTTGSSNLKDTLSISILLTLEAVVDKLGGFLNPYMADILGLIVLHPLYVSTTEPKLKLKADVVRKLITDRIPVRLLLPPVLGIYSDAAKSGESSLSIVFEMLGNLVNSMDRSSIGAYYTKIFDLCLLALDLRRQHPASIKNIIIVEKNVLSATVTLTMKLTETMFRPLFIKSIEWSSSDVEDSEYTPGQTINRIISFYALVNKLAENHRSLFVPYFKYLLDGCVQYLVHAGDTKPGLVRKKKTKLHEASNNSKDRDVGLSLEMWHLRALILSSLHKCFLYDTGSLRFLDSSNFQVLLKPIVSQLVVDPPVSLELYPDIPSVKEVDDLLVACIGQMAVTAGSDLLWKPLNHEVLMQTRAENVRPRILGLRIVQYLVEKLKEEYLAFLPETIPFLGELLEDVELPVKSLAQEILKEMETLSGESLRQYL
ncbi:uncharacterized protein At3g06530 isoform X3 [Olea europaea var. sylvestris]|uniref:uncharacterized protein At3g06530 isoform X3 n=1 Tax=Olea europaea var. sylvestris TaxID=158386 RepID=UPI000C1CDCD2|nr:uncharacterized protein At3g06530 isoform X3 [Olea europaea var. sylvestris]